jgi:protein TonB
MFETLSGSRRSRPALTFSLGAHVLLAGLLTVPPLLATQEPPEPEERIPPFVPMDFAVVKSEENPILLRKERQPERRARSASSEAPAPVPPPESTEKKENSVPLLSPAQSPDVPSTVPTAPDDSPYSPLEEGSRSERKGPPGSLRNDTGGSPAGCEGCPPGSGIFSLGSADVVAPVAIFTPEPQYPETPRRVRMSGWVAVEAIIGTDGSVRDVRVLRSSSPLFEASAIEAVHRWRYVAARIGSRAVPVYLTVNVTFTLRT